MDFPRLLSVEPRPHHRIFLRYADGVEGEYDLGYLLQPNTVFEPIRNEVVFQQVQVVSNGRAIEWPNDVDLCTRTLYMRLTGTLETSDALSLHNA